MKFRVLDLFAGPGGVDEGLRALGVHDVLGIEWDETACRTAEAAGHKRLNADVSELDPSDFTCEGLWASPPCQAFSAAGKGLGKTDLPALYEHITACRDGWVDHGTRWADPRSPLILQVLRWVDTIRPEWVACEQVPACLPIWQEMAHTLEGWGYSTWVGTLEAERYGVPQTRERAFLMAHRTRPVAPPEPTHQRYVKGEPQGHGTDALFSAVKPWVSMADALDWSEDDLYHRWRGAGLIERHGPRPDTPATEPAPTVTTRWNREWRLRTGNNSATKGPGHRDAPWRERTEPYERGCDQPAPTVDTKALHAWTLRMGNQPNACERGLDEPAPTVLFGHRSNDNTWVERRPATTIVGSFGHDVVAAPGYRTEVSRQNAEGSVKITLSEALILQGFRPDYPVQGFKSKQGEQVGNAVPPPLAAAVCGALLGIDWQEAAA